MKGRRNMKGTFKTLKTFKKLDEPELYVMDYVADYNLDKLLAMGSGSDEEFAKNVCKILLNGLPVAVKPEGGCSTFTATTRENESLFARNFDYRTGMPMVIRAFPKRGLKSVSLSNLGHIGFNEKHLPDENFISKFKTLAAVYSPIEGMSLLEAAQMDGHKYYEPGHMYYDSKTQWSVVYNLNKCTATVSVRTDYKNKHVFNLSEE